MNKGKTFQTLYKIFLDEIMEKYIKETKKEIDTIEKYLYYIYSPKENISIKELNEGPILIGYNKYLMEVKLNDKNYEGKVISKIDGIILNINELPDKKIIVITNKDIKIYIKESDKYIFKTFYLFKDNWKLKPTSNSYYTKYKEFYQYFSSYILPNNKFLLNSFSTESSSHSGYIPLTREFSNSKIIFIDLNNFEEITSTEIFNYNSKYIITENNIYIQTYENILIYNINTLELEKNIKLDSFDVNIYKYDEQDLISLSNKNDENYLTIIKIGKNIFNKYKLINPVVSFKGKSLWEINKVIGPHKKYLYTLKNKKVIFIWLNKIYIFRINTD